MEKNLKWFKKKLKVKKNLVMDVRNLKNDFFRILKD